MSALSSHSELEVQLLDRFASWTSDLPNDVRTFASELENPDNPSAVRLALASALNYLVKSVDLIEDGIETLGYLDDAMVLRMALAGAKGAIPEPLQPMRGDTGILLEFLGPLTGRFERFVEDLGQLSVRGQTAEALLADETALGELLVEVRSFAARYQTPVFRKEASLLVKLHSFLDAKLPRN